MWTGSAHFEGCHERGAKKEGETALDWVDNWVVFCVSSLSCLLVLAWDAEGTGWTIQNVGHDDRHKHRRSTCCMVYWKNDDRMKIADGWRRESSWMTSLMNGNGW